MRLCAMAGAGVAAVIAAGASATVTGLQVDYNGLIGGRHVWSVYAVSNDVNHVMLSVIGHTVTAGSMAGVQHNDFVGNPIGTWNPALTLLPDQLANDSFITAWNPWTNVQPALSWDGWDGFLNGPAIPNGFGWTVALNPPLTFEGGRIKIMQVAGASFAPGIAHYTARLTIGYKATLNSTTPSYAENLTYTIGIPAPGALALLGLAAAASGRRRR